MTSTLPVWIRLCCVCRNVALPMPLMEALIISVDMVDITYIFSPKKALHVQSWPSICWVTNSYPWVISRTPSESHGLSVRWYRGNICIEKLIRYQRGNNLTVKGLRLVDKNVEPFVLTDISRCFRTKFGSALDVVVQLLYASRKCIHWHQSASTINVVSTNSGQRPT